MIQTQMGNTVSISENNRNKIQQLFSMQSQIKWKFNEQKINQKSIIFIGDTNVGKTALLYYLSGMKLNLVENTTKKTKQIQPETVHLNAKVSNSLSTTEVPNIFSFTQQSTSVSLIDMPGMNDKRFINVLSNMFTFKQVFEKLEKTTKIHIIFVISQEIFDFQQIKQNFRQFLSRFNVESFKETKNISIIFTKTEDDQQTVQQKFIEIIDEIHEYLEDDQEQKDILSLIELIKQLNDNQKLIYVFPKEDPVKDLGLEITKSILERNSFGNIDQMLLHEFFIDNVMTSQKNKISSFENNLAEVISLSSSQISNCIDFSIGFVRFLHKKIVPQIFSSQEDFKTQLQTFYEKFQSYILNEQSLSSQMSLQRFLQFMGNVCEKISETKEIYALDKALKQFFQNSTSSELETDFTGKVSRLLADILGKTQKVLQKLSQTQQLISLISKTQKFMNWLSESWSPILIQINSLESIKNLINQKNQFIENQISLKWEKISQQNSFIETLNKFSIIPSQSEDENQSQSSEEIQVQEQIQDKGYYGSTVSQLKRKLMKVQPLTNLNQYQAKVQQVLKQQRLLQGKIRTLVQLIESKVIELVKAADQSDNYQIKIKAQQIPFILFQMRNLRHKVFLQSALKYFGVYLKFIHYSLNSESEKRVQMQILRGFVGNICMVLDQYALFEEQILLLLFSCSYNKIVKVFERGLRTGRIGKQFIKDQLIGHLSTLIENPSKVEVEPQLSAILIAAYNYLMVQYSESKQEHFRYEKEMHQKLNKLKQNVNKYFQASTNRSTNPSNSNNNEIQQPNYFVLIDNPYFQFQTILNKVDILEKRNAHIQTYKIYLHFNQHLNLQQRGK